jgi:hypothetical protein
VAAAALANTVALHPNQFLCGQLTEGMSYHGKSSSSRQTRVPLGGVTDAMRRTDNLQALTTRDLRLLNTDGSYPTQNSMIYVGDTIGHVDFSAASLTGDGSLFLPGTLTVGGTTTLDGATTMNGETTINGQLNAEGLTNLNGPIQATGNITLTSAPPTSAGGNAVLSYNAGTGAVELQTGASTGVTSIVAGSTNVVVDPSAGAVTVDLCDNLILGRADPSITFDLSAANIKISTFTEMTAGTSLLIKPDSGSAYITRKDISDGEYLMIQQATNSDSYIRTVGGGHLYLGTGSTNTVKVEAVSGNIGIGTDTPSATLDVSGHIMAQTFSATGTVSPYFAGNYTASVGPGWNALRICDPSGSARWGIGLDNVEAGANSGSDLVVNRYDDNGTELPVSLTIARQSSNVGIGTMTPTATLDIYNALPYEDISTNTTPPLNAQVHIGSTSHRLKLGSYYTSTVGDAAVIQSTDVYSGADHGENLLLNPVGGYVGIGTITPTAALDVSGGLCLTGLPATTNTSVLGINSTTGIVSMQPAGGGVPKVSRIGMGTNYSSMPIPPGSVGWHELNIPAGCAFSNDISAGTSPDPNGIWVLDISAFTLETNNAITGIDMLIGIGNSIDPTIYYNGIPNISMIVFFAGTLAPTHHYSCPSVIVKVSDLIASCPNMNSVTAIPRLYFQNNTPASNICFQSAPAFFNCYYYPNGFQ